MTPSEAFKEVVFNPEKGSQYKFRIITGRVIDQKVLGKKIQSRDNSIINLSFKVFEGSFQGNYEIAVEFDSTKTTEKSRIFDDILLPNESATESEGVIKGLKGTSFFLRVSGAGQLIDIKSNRGVNKKVPKSNIGAFSGLTSKDTFFIRQHYLMDLVKNKMFVLPDVGIGLNSSWKRTDSVGLVPVTFMNCYNVYDMKDGLIFIKMLSTINQNILVGNQFPTHITGCQEGEIILEEKNGMLLKNNSKLNISCSIERNGVAILQDVLITADVERIY